ncbi:MAG: sugar ABC transporter ATP-binding protein [Rhizobiaceae bacterium]|nr:sugar ABC transporter ATP-binding protein [Rhizobiaceae bacterium]
MNRSVSIQASVGASSPAISLSGITKRFGDFAALTSVDFEVRPGEVHVLFGENGAGKSTLINIIAGTLRQSEGDYRFFGSEIRELTPSGARDLGIRPVFQEFSLADQLNVVENMFLGRELTVRGRLDHSAMHSQATQIIANLGFDLAPDVQVGRLDRSRRQMTEIAKAMLGSLKVLILDEPSASLTEAETYRLFEIVEKLRQDGIAIIYVSHRMAEIERLADRITVLRDGCLIGTVKAADTDSDGLVSMMTGRAVGMLYPKIAHAPRSPGIEVRNLTLASGAVSDVSVIANAGEVTGIAGLVDCGKSEVIRAAFGLEEISSGEVLLHGNKMDVASPADSLKKGVCYFPSDRVAEGLALDRSVRENASMAALDTPLFSKFGFIRKRREKEKVASIASQLKLRPARIEGRVGSLSGGNRQKVVLARGLARETEVYLFDEPTVGIDVGAKAEVYEVIRELVEAGKTVVLVSSDLPEVLALSNRLYVMHRSRISAQLKGEDINEAEVLSHFFPEDGHADRPDGDKLA